MEGLEVALPAVFIKLKITMSQDVKSALDKKAEKKKQDEALPKYGKISPRHPRTKEGRQDAPYL